MGASPSRPANEPLEALLQTSTANFRYLADIAATGVLVMRDSKIIYMNPCVSATLGYAQPEELYGQEIISFFVGTAARQILMERMERTLRTGEPNLPRQFRMVRKDGNTVLVESQSFAVTLDGHPCVLALVQDLSELERADAAHQHARKEQQAREQAEQRMLEARALQLATDLTLQHMTEGALIDAFLQRLRELVLCDIAISMVMSEDGTELTVESVEPSFSSLKPAMAFPLQDPLWARTVAQGQGVVIDDATALEEEDKCGTALGLRSLLAVPLRQGSQVVRALVIGAERPYAFNQVHMQLLSRAYERIGFAIERARLYDRLRAKQERLRLLSQQLVAAQETERRQLARELHDEVGQLLTALSLTLERSQRGDVSEAQSAAIATAQTMVTELVSRVREMSLTLRPTMLDDLGLLPTLQWHIERFHARTRVQVTLYSRVKGRFSSEIETAVYRIVQEALNNIARYAEVEEATVALWQTEYSLCVEITDRGVGFEMVKLAGQSTFGLSSMHERASLLGGTCTIDSVVGEGTRVLSEFPLIPRESREGRP